MKFISTVFFLCGFLVSLFIFCIESFSIAECSKEGWAEVWESTEQFFACQGLGSSQTAVWQVNSPTAGNTELTCGPVGQLCSSTHSDIKVTRSNATTSVLIIERNHRDLLGGGSIFCKIQNSTTASCSTNVVDRAKLSQCDVSADVREGTVTGSCHFQGAFSSNRTYTCTWYQHSDNAQNQTITGTIQRNQVTISGKQYYDGTCKFTAPLNTSGQEKTYVYTVTFFPGPQQQFVKNITTGITTIGTTTTGTTTTVVPDQITKGAGGGEERRTVVPDQTTKGAGGGEERRTGTVTSTVTSLPKTSHTTDKEDVPLAAIVGSVVGVVALIIIIVIIIVVVKKRQKKNDESDQPPPAEKNQDDDSVQEIINPLYGTGNDDQDSYTENSVTHKTAPPKDVSFQGNRVTFTTISLPPTPQASSALPKASTNGPDTCLRDSDIADVHTYSNVDDVQSHRMSPAWQGQESDGYSDVGNVGAAVSVSGSGDGEDGCDGDTHSTHSYDTQNPGLASTDVYAVVNKHRPTSGSRQSDS